MTKQSREPGEDRQPGASVVQRTEQLSRVESDPERQRGASHAQLLPRGFASQAEGLRLSPAAGMAALARRLQRAYGNRHTGEVVRRAAQSGGAFAAPPEVETAIQRARGGGQPLDGAAREQLEPALGADFSGVRVHTGAEAHGLNESLEARAFTVGNDIFFRDGEYSPGSDAGRRLLAHELTHVVQQTGAIHPQLMVGAVDDEYERQAEGVEHNLEALSLTFNRQLTIQPARIQRAEPLTALAVAGGIASAVGFVADAISLSAGQKNLPSAEFLDLKPQGMPIPRWGGRIVQETIKFVPIKPLNPIFDDTDISYVIQCYCGNGTISISIISDNSSVSSLDTCEAIVSEKRVDWVDFPNTNEHRRMPCVSFRITTHLDALGPGNSWYHHYVRVIPVVENINDELRFVEDSDKQPYKIEIITGKIKSERVDLGYKPWPSENYCLLS